MGPRMHHTSTVIEKTAEVALRSAPNSAAIGLKNAPKLYATAYVAHIATNAAATIRHARGESNRSRRGAGSFESRAPATLESVTAFMLKRGAGRLQCLPPPGVDDGITQIEVLQRMNNRRGHHQARVPFLVCRHHVPWRGRCRRLLDHFFVCAHVIVPSSPLQQVGIGKFPVLLGLIEAIEKPLLLFFLRDI